MTSAVLALVIGFFLSSPTEPEHAPTLEASPWRTVHFGPLHPAIVETSLAQVLVALRSEGELACTGTARTTVSWECIVAVLERWAAIEARLFAHGNVRPRDTHDGVLALQMRHAGRLWSFWRDVAVLKVTADRVGGEQLFTREFGVVLRAMEEAFGAALTAAESTE